MNSLPDSVLLNIFSFIHWRQRVKFESVSTRWNKILLDKSLRMIRCVDLNNFVKDDLLLPQAIQSLVVEKRKIISELIAINQGVDAPVGLVIELVSSVQPNYLTRLEVKGTRGLISNISPIIHSLVNLEVLELELIDCDEHGLYVNLSQLVRLKCLVGFGVYYANCRSPCLTKVKYTNVGEMGDGCEVDHNSPYADEVRDFIQMLAAAAPVIEVISLDVVGLCYSGDQHETVVALPMLTKLKMDETSIFNLVFDLRESSDLQVIDFVDASVSDGIINLDKSVHSLVRLNTDASGVANQFLISVLNNPDSLCLLEDFDISLEYYGNEVPSIFDKLIEVFNSFSLSYTYSLRRVNVYGSSPILRQHCNALIVLLQCCPRLDVLTFSYFDIDKECLIDLIVATVALDNDLEIKFNRVNNNVRLSSFISDLLVALSLIDCSTICYSNVRLVLLYPQSDWDDNRSSLEYIVNKYGITITHERRRESSILI